jgi:hypothetical protein
MKRFGLHFSAVLFCEIQGFHDGEDGGSVFLRNVGIYLQVHKATQKANMESFALLAAS